MSYAICNVLCGYEVTGRLADFVYEVDAADEIGFEQFYSGNGSPPLVCGIVTYSFHEGQNINVDDLKLKVTPKQMEKAQKKMDETKQKLIEFIAQAKLELAQDDPDGEGFILSEQEEKAIIDSLPTKPTIRLVWSSS
jgi:hypothetical protein